MAHGAGHGTDASSANGFSIRTFLHHEAFGGVLLLACADPGTPASQAFVDVLRRHLAGQVVDGAILVAPAGLDAEAMPAAQGTERLRVLDREALHGLLGEAVVDAPSMPATPSNASSSRKHPKGRKANRFDLLFRAIAVLCAIGFVLAVLVLLSRTAETAAEPPPDPAPASTR